MRHAWSCHDPERKLVYMGVYAGRAGTAGSSPTALRVNYRGGSYTWEEAAGVVENGLP
jgi:hypothetical protein